MAIPAIVNSSLRLHVCMTWGDNFVGTERLEAPGPRATFYGSSNPPLDTTPRLRRSVSRRCRRRKCRTSTAMGSRYRSCCRCRRCAAPGCERPDARTGVGPDRPRRPHLLALGRDLHREALRLRTLRRAPEGRRRPARCEGEGPRPDDEAMAAASASGRQPRRLALRLLPQARALDPPRPEAERSARPSHGR